MYHTINNYFIVKDHHNGYCILMILPQNPLPKVTNRKILNWVKSWRVLALHFYYYTFATLLRVTWVLPLPCNHLHHGGLPRLPNSLFQSNKHPSYLNLTELIEKYIQIGSMVVIKCEQFFPPSGRSTYPPQSHYIHVS